MNEMRKCPFCGYDGLAGWPDYRIQGFSDGYQYQAQCLECGAYGPGQSSKANALTSWNMRADDQLTQEAVSAAQTSNNVDAGPRSATSKELLEAVAWFLRDTNISLAAVISAVSYLRLGFALAQPGGWEHVAPMWLRESRKLAEAEG